MGQSGPSAIPTLTTGEIEIMKPRMNALMNAATFPVNLDDTTLAEIVDYAYGPAAAHGRQAQARALHDSGSRAVAWLRGFTGRAHNTELSCSGRACQSQ